MIAMGIDKAVRERIMSSLLEGRPPAVRSEILSKILADLKRRNVIHRVSVPAAERSMSPSQAKDKLFALMNSWTRDAAKDWQADNRGRDIQEVAFDLSKSFLYEPEVADLMEKANFDKRTVEDMVADRLVR
jgi:hypothetical protein